MTMTLRRAATVGFLATSKPAVARTFFRDRLGLKLTAEDGFAIVFDTLNGPLRIQKVDTVAPQPFTAFGWVVSNARRSVRALTKRGVRFEHYPFMDQDDDGIWLAPSGTKVAWFKDPDGNILSLSEPPRG
jgi:catechol 2,3-dioxygenase-like lactoylglutathione lyase family enzyme